MSYIYVVVSRSGHGDDPEGGGLIPEAFATFEEAKKEALKRFPDELEMEKEAIEEGSLEESVVDTKESKDKDITEIYLEKGNNIYIHKLKVPTTGGKRRKTRKSRK